MSLYTELWNRIGDIGRDVGILSKKINNVALFAISDNTSIYRTDRDATGVFVTTTWKRLDGTIAKQSVLSLPDGSLRYTRRTETIYDLDGTTALTTRVFTLTYNGTDQIISEVLS